MTDDRLALRGFKATFTIIGILYVVMASSFLVRGAGDVLPEFGVSAALATEPVLVDFFDFFYQLMAAVGVMMVLFGQCTREGRSQQVVAGVFCALNVAAMLRDLSTSDTPLGDRLYTSDKVLVFVAISLVFALAFGVLALGRWRVSARSGLPADGRRGAADEQDAREYQR